MPDTSDQPAKERRDRWLPKIRASRPELDAIESRRAASGLPLSEYIRKLALTGHVLQRKPLQDKALVRELSAIGNNLNQLSRRANVRGEVDADIEQRLNGLLVPLEDLIERLLVDC